jgi:predicted DNA-binding transcriptional regulator YafY
MTTLSYRKRLHELLLLIRKERIKSLSQGAELMHCSKATVKRMIAALRQQHFEIVYDKKLARYKDKTGES